MARFLCVEDLVPGAEIALSEAETHHLLRVLRRNTGDEIELVNGRGMLARARIVSTSKKCRVLVEEVQKEENPFRIRICFGLPKATALDFLIRRCSEVGVEGFQPLVTQFSMKKNAWNKTRWERVVAEVGKQCQAVNFPSLHEPLPLSQWLKEREEHPLIFCNEQDRFSSTSIPKDFEKIDLLIGPEGGWSTKESEEIIHSNALLFGLGQHRLRLETAALVASVILKTKIGEL